MKNVLSILLILGIAFHGLSQTKRALIIANGDYQEETDWPDISSAADIPIIQSALERQGFEGNITVAQDLTKENMVSEIDNFIKTVEEGDIVFFHFSGHGIRMTDDSGDEIDKLDETLVPVDAPLRMPPGGEYRGELHYSDDLFSEKLYRIRQIIGEEGHLIVTLDACHSGTGTRGGTSLTRGGGKPITWETNAKESKEKTPEKFGYAETPKSRGGNEQLGVFVTIAAASFDELNYETKDDNGNGVGSLSYALSKALSEATEDMSYQQLYANILAIMADKVPYQNPMLEGDIEYKLFNGDIVEQEPYYQIVKVQNADTVVIDGGTLNGAPEGSVVGVYPAGTSNPFESEDKLMVKGTVTMAGPLNATVKLDEAQEIKNVKKYYVFVLEKNIENAIVKVSLNGVTNPNFQKGLEKAIGEKNVLEVVKEDAEADIQVGLDGNELIFRTPDYSWNCGIGGGFGQCVESLQQYAEGSFLKKTEFEDPNYQLEIEYIPVNAGLEDDGRGGKKVVVYDTLSLFDYYDEALSLAFPVGSQFLIRVTNTGRRTTYFGILDIQPDGKINQVLPVIDEEAKILPEECKVKAGESMIIPNYFVEVNPPAGLETFKIFASPNPINTQVFVKERGNKDGMSRGDIPDLDLFILDIFESGSRSRGATGKSGYKSTSNTGSSFNRTFKIVE